MGQRAFSSAPKIKQQLRCALLPRSVYREIVRKHPSSQRRKSNDAADQRRRGRFEEEHFAAAISSRGTEWMDGKNASVTLSVCLMLDGKQTLRLTEITSLKRDVMRRINVGLSAAGCFVRAELFNVGMWQK